MVDSREAIPLLEGCRIALDLFAHRTDIDWSFLSPPWLYRPGKVRGSYHLGIDYVPMENGHPAGIDVPDLALAVCDETERRALIRHWTVSGAGGAGELPDGPETVSGPGTMRGPLSLSDHL